MKFIMLTLLAIAGLACVSNAEENAVPEVTIEKSLEIGRALSDFPVGFCLLTAGRDQFVAYYDENRNMTVASRTLDSDQWQYRILPSKIEWDSHNYITMAMDDDGQLHVTGNMHRDPLVYFRTENPGDIATLKMFQMTGKQEKEVTYPNFLRDKDDRLLFTYRDGGSGKGNNIYNKYDSETRTWTRLFDSPLLDGEGVRNAYPSKPKMGKDGFFHMIWVWRDTPDCATNHHLSYARSKDMVHWESAFGEAVALPLRLEHRQLWVDPIPSGGGIINGGAKLGFDSRQLPVISYHKNDAEGNMQIYAARPEGGKWQRHLLTQWNKPLKFSGNGSMPFIGIAVDAVQSPEQDILTLSYNHRDYGKGLLVLHEKTFEPLDKKPTSPPSLPRELKKIESDFDGMGIKRAHDMGSSGDEAVSYILQWETLGAHHDRPRQDPLPQPSMLRLHKISRR